MNAGKLVGTLAAIAIIVYCCYGAVLDALPSNVQEFQDTLSNPLEFNDSVEITSDVDGSNATVTIVKGSITSHLPQTVKDVYVTLYVGEGDVKIDLGTIQIGDLVPDVKTDLAGEELEVPLYVVMAYAVCTDDGDSGLQLPLCIKAGFKYFEWQATYLIDMDITLKLDMPIEGVTPVVTVDGNDAKVELKLDNSDNNMLLTLADELGTSGMVSDDGYVHLTCGGAEIKVGTVKSGDTTSITFETLGSTDKTAVELLKDAIASNDGKLQLTCEKYTESTGENLPALEGDNVNTFLDILQKLYEGGASA